MDTCNNNNSMVDNVEEQVSFLFKMIILVGIVMIAAAVSFLLKRYNVMYFIPSSSGSTSIKECAKVSSAPMACSCSEFPSPPVQQKSTDKGELVF